MSGPGWSPSSSRPGPGRPGLRTPDRPRGPRASSHSTAQLGDTPASFTRLGDARTSQGTSRAVATTSAVDEDEPSGRAGQHLNPVDRIHRGDELHHRLRSRRHRPCHRPTGSRRPGRLGGTRVLAGEVNHHVAGADLGVFLEEAQHRAAGADAGEQPMALGAAHPDAQMAVGIGEQGDVGGGGGDLVMRPISPPGASTAWPAWRPAREPRPSSSCCHQPAASREITGAVSLLGSALEIQQAPQPLVVLLKLGRDAPDPPAAEPNAATPPGPYRARRDD